AQTPAWDPTAPLQNYTHFDIPPIMRVCTWSAAGPPQQWISRAGEDLAVARLALREGHTAHACFLAQKCAGKSPKAYLLARAAVPLRDYARPQYGISGAAAWRLCSRTCARRGFVEE